MKTTNTEVDPDTSADDMSGLLNDIFRQCGESSGVPHDDDIEVSDDVIRNAEAWGGDVETLFADMEKELYPGCKECGWCWR